MIRYRVGRLPRLRGIRPVTGARIGGMYQNRPARVDGVLALSAGTFFGVTTGVTSSSVWEGISTGTAIAAAFILARLLIRG